MATVIAIGDLHMPFVNEYALSELFKRIKAIVKRHKKVTFVQIGDAFDMFSYGRFARSHNLMTPKEEETLGKVMLEHFWEQINYIAPKSEKYQLKGNHCDRPIKQILAKAPEYEHMVKEYVEKLYSFDGVTTIHDSREELEIDGTYYIHGYKTKLGDHARFNHRSVVHGHTHRGGVIFLPINGRDYFELDCGYLGDRFSPAMSYTGQKKATTWTTGFGVIDADGPRFISLPESYQQR